MRKSGLIAAVCCAFALCLALVGCGGGSSSAAASSSSAVDVKAAWVGTWDLVEMEEDGEVTGSEDIDMLRALGLDVYLNLDEDGTCALVLFGESMEGTWEAATETEATVTMEDQPVEATQADGRLTLTQGDSKLVFEKGEAKDPAATAALAGDDDDDDFEETDTPIDEVVIADDDAVKIAVTALRVDFEGDVGYVLQVTNKTDESLGVISEDGWTVDGAEIEGVLATTVDANDTEEAFLWFDHEDLGSSDVSALVAVEGDLTTFDLETYEDLQTYHFQM